MEVIATSDFGMGTHTADQPESGAEFSEDIDDPELDQLLCENSGTSSESEPETPEVQDDEHKQQRSRTRIREEEGPANTLAILMISCWLMRVPVTYQDFVRCVSSSSRRRLSLKFPGEL